MAALRRRAAEQQEASAQAALERAIGALRKYQRAGLVMIPVGDVLRLLDTAPRDDPAPQQEPPPRRPVTRTLTR